MRKFTNGLGLRTSVSVIAMVLGCAGSAAAQTAQTNSQAEPAQEVETVVVRGYRASVADALATKRN
jgi:predicted naringenin-chalcone synthase